MSLRRWLFPAILVLSVASACLFAQAPQGRKFALLVGANNYAGSDLGMLKYAENDVTRLAELLPSLGYEPDRIVLMTEARFRPLHPTARNILKELDRLMAELKREDSLLVAFAGHGVHLKQFKEVGLFFCPLDTVLTDPESMVSLTQVYNKLKGSAAGTKLLFVDMCRNDPFDGRGVANSRVESVTRPLVSDPPGGTVVFFSCSLGQRAFESDTLKHGVFFYHLLEGLKGAAALPDGRVTVPALEEYLNRSVPAAVKREKGADVFQVPERRGELRGTYVLARKPGSVAALTARPGASVGPGTSIEGQSAVRTQATPQPPALVREFKIGNGMEFVLVPSGEFFMGAPATEEDHETEEAPRRAVRITRFYSGKYEVTRGQFKQFVEAEQYVTDAEKTNGGSGWDPATGQFRNDRRFNWRNPGFVQADDHPVVNISWQDAQAFCNWMNKGKDRPGKYTLLTEAEWEYAARAGTTTRFSSGGSLESLAAVANMPDAAFFRATRLNGVGDTGRLETDDKHAFTAPVGRFAPNAFGLHDMHGNVWEWCADWFGEAYYGAGENFDPKGPAAGVKRVLRGGSFAVGPKMARTGHRVHATPQTRGKDLGFRICFRP